jgi:hypothetical protein
MTWILVTGLLIGQMKASEVYRFLIFERPHVPLLRSSQNTAISDDGREPIPVPTKMKLSESTDSINTCVLYGYKRTAVQWFLHLNLAHNKLHKYSTHIPWTNTAFWVVPSWFKPVWIVSSYQEQTGINQHNNDDDDDDDDDYNNNNNDDVKTKVIVVIIGAHGTVWNSFEKIPQKHSGPARYQRTTKHSHPGHCTHTLESVNVKIQNIFNTRNNISCSTNCKYRTAATLYIPEIWFVSGI